MDPAARDYIIRTIINNYNRDASVIICTHLISDIEDILDEVIFLMKGHLVLRGTKQEIMDKYGVSVDKHFREVFKC